MYHKNQEVKSLKDIIRSALNENRSYLMEHECKKILEDWGIKTTGSRVACSEDEAVQISREIGFPVVLKVLSPEVVHKTDAGGVKLGLDGENEVRKAYREIVDSFKDLSVAGVSVQKMAPPGIEAIVGILQDQCFGPVIMFGLGGIFTEVLKDVSFRIVPISPEDADHMMEEIRGSKILKGYRGMSADIPSLRDLLLKVSALAEKEPHIRDMDLNPLFLYPSGYVVADAKIFINAKPTRREIRSRGIKDLHRLFYPDSIAVIGATESTGKLGYNVMFNLVSHGFRGRIYPVNPAKKAIFGMKAYGSVMDIDGPVDVAIVIIPAAHVPDAVMECCRKGVKFVVIESAGFAETGERGKRLQADIDAILSSGQYTCSSLHPGADRRDDGPRKTGQRDFYGRVHILGPNCSGIINTHHDMVQSIGIVGELRKGNVGLIAQAGVYAAGILVGLCNIMDFGIVATIGNKMDITETHILEFLGRDRHIKVIAMYMEDVKSGRHFIDVARRITAIKPVIVLKTGRTGEGKKAILSHTASMAGNEDINDAAFRQAGIIRVKDNRDMFALTRAFSKQPMPSGRGVMVITYTGSFGVAATDHLYLNGMRLSRIEPHLLDRMKEVLPDYLNLQNPVDCSFTMDPHQVERLVEIGAMSNDVHSFIVIIQGERLASFIDPLSKVDRKGKPMVCCVACKEFMMEHVIKMEQAGIPVYSTPEMAVEVLSRMYYYREHVLKK